MKPVFLDAKKNYTKNITMPTAEEIRDFAAEEGFREQGCENELGCGTDCPDCGGKGVVYIMHGVTWPPVAIEMMMADKHKHKAIVDALLHVAAAQTATNQLLLDALDKAQAC